MRRGRGGAIKPAMPAAPMKERISQPSPWIAVARKENGIEVTLIGGQISTRGGICVGMDTEAQLGTMGRSGGMRS
ncbi:hypothetical protein FGG78_07670 [Thioclava sp. BHET1]|nr:hypothetical protein FGG78_07670 [Thioclava sp. BHET1]